MTSRMKVITAATRLFIPAMIWTIGACGSSDSEDRETEISGPKVPVSFIQPDKENKTAYVYDSQNRLTKAYNLPSTNDTRTFVYYNDILDHIAFTYPPNVDGASRLKFIQEEPDKMKAVFYHPDSTPFEYADTLYINKEGYVTKMCMGKTETYLEYDLFSYDPSDGKLLKKERIRAYDTRQETKITYTYTYDNNPGTARCINCPKWLAVYCAERLPGSSADYHLLNYVNNVIKMTASGLGPSQDFIFTYTYDKEGYPTSYRNFEKSIDYSSIRYQAAR